MTAQRVAGAARSALRHQPVRLLHDGIDGSIGFGIRWESLAPAALDRLKTWLKAVIFGASIVQARRSQRFTVRITHSELPTRA